MPRKSLEAIEEYFSKVTDPRKDRTKDHKLIDIIAIASDTRRNMRNGRLDRHRDLWKQKGRLAQNLPGVTEWDSIA